MDWNVSLETQPPEFGKRANPAERYETQSANLNPREQILLRCLRKAVANGWQGWRGFVNDAVTIGQEADGVLRDMRKVHAPVEPLIFNIEFAQKLWPDDWQEFLMFMAIEEDRIKYLDENVD